MYRCVWSSARTRLDAGGQRRLGDWIACARPARGRSVPERQSPWPQNRGACAASWLHKAAQCVWSRGSQIWSRACAFSRALPEGVHSARTRPAAQLSGGAVVAVAA